MKPISIIKYTLFYKQHFYKQCQAQMAKNQTKAKQHPETELLQFENYSFSSSSYHPKIIEDILKNVQKTSTPVQKRLYD